MSPFWKPSSGLTDKREDVPMPEESCGFLDRITVGWIFPLLRVSIQFVVEQSKFESDNSHDYRLATVARSMKQTCGVSRNLVVRKRSLNS
jgi:hypothetical protein